MKEEKRLKSCGGPGASLRERYTPSLIAGGPLALFRIFFLTYLMPGIQKAAYRRPFVLSGGFFMCSSLVSP
jgi:hypothetical protein